MKLKEVTFDQLIQIRQYEPCRISATAIINEGESETQVMSELKTFVQSELRKAYQAAHAKAPVTNQSAL